MYSNQEDYYSGGNWGYSDGQGQGQQNQQGYYYQPGQDPGYDPYAQHQQQTGGYPNQQQHQDQGGYYPPNMNNMPGMNNLNPVLTNMARQYGENLVGQGKEIVDQKIQRFVSVSKLKYYFAVDTTYVIKKLGLLFFPYSHKDWSIRFDKNEDDSVQPRFEVNAPDLYIPLMAFITYLLIAGVSLGMQQKFSPEMLGIQASSALGWLILELMVFTGCTYVIQTDLKIFDLVAFCSYKFVGMILILLGCLFNRLGYYVALAYFSLSLSVFLIRTLKVQIYSVASHESVVSGNKTRLYFLLTLAGFQPILMWWLTYHLTNW